jgi:hypothetical protein
VVTGKQAYLRTLEAIIAVFITFLFLIYISPERSISAAREENLYIMPVLAKNLAFRNCVLSQNVSCINSTIDDNLPNQYNYLFNLSSDPNLAVSGLPTKRVFADSAFVTGNSTQHKPLIVRLYYWSR